jgi:integrase
MSEIDYGWGTRMPKDQSNKRVVELLTQIRDLLKDQREHPTDTQRPSPQASMPLRVVLAKYLDQKFHEVTLHHLKNVKYTLETFITALSPTAITLDEVTMSLVASYRDSMCAEGTTVSTVNHHMASIAAMFNWAISRGLTQQNPAMGLKLRNPSKASNERRAFTHAEIKTIFRPAFWTRTEHLPLAHRWLPLIMLYTGARPEEIAQLRVRDFRSHCGYDVFDFAVAADDQRRKNEASRRLVPVHPALLNMGLLDFAGGDSRRYLFPELNPGINGRFAEAPSRWFNETWLRKETGLLDRQKVLYSLRHTVATSLKVDHGVEESLIAQILGHTYPGMTNGRYGKEYPMEHLANTVALLKWPVAQAVAELWVEA